MIPRRAQQGFSLLEVVVVVAIAVTVVLVVGNFSNNVTGLDTLVTSELQSKSDVNESVAVMAREIQSAAVSASGAYPIDSASTSSFAFYSDIYQTGSPVHVRYFFASSTIFRGVIRPTGTPATYPTSSEVLTDVADNVIVASSTPLFSYYGSSYTGSQSALTYPLSLSSIRLVGVSFEVQSNTTSTTNRSPIQYFSDLIDIRNLDSN